MSRKIILISAIVIISLLALLVFVFGLPFDVNGKATGIFSLKCTDSDGGLNYYVRGSAIDDDSVINETFRKVGINFWPQMASFMVYNKSKNKDRCKIENQN